MQILHVQVHRHALLMNVFQVVAIVVTIVIVFNVSGTVYTLHTYFILP